MSKHAPRLYTILTAILLSSVCESQGSTPQISGSTQKRSYNSLGVVRSLRTFTFSAQNSKGVFLVGCFCQGSCEGARRSELGCGAGARGESFPKIPASQLKKPWCIFRPMQINAMQLQSIGRIGFTEAEITVIPERGKTKPTQL